MTQPELHPGVNATEAYTPADPVVAPFDYGLRIVAIAASSRVANAELERERLAHVENVLSVARAANAALHMWVTQCLSEYRGSRTAWDLPATSELLGEALAQFEASVHESATRLSEVMPEIVAESSEPLHGSPTQ